MDKYCTVVTSLALSLAVVPDVRCDVPLVLERLVDSETPIPGGEGSFFLDNVAPSPCQVGTVFAGADASLTQTGIYAVTEAGIVVIADEQSPAPGGGVFDELRMPACRGSSTAFVGANTATGLDGIYGWRAGQVRLLAKDGTSAPQGGGTLGGLNHPDPATVSTAFRALILPVGIEGLFLAGGEPVAIQAVADTSTAVPGMPTTFSGFGGPTLSDLRLAFRGFYGVNGQGIYSWSGGNLEIVADQHTAVPGQSGQMFTTFGQPSVWDDQVVFVATYPGGQGVYGTTTSGLQELFASGDPAPGGGAFLSFDRAQAGPGSRAFFALTNTGDRALFLEWLGEVHRVVGIGDTLDGEQIFEVTYSLGDRGLAFRGLFGDSSQAIYLVRLDGLAIPVASTGMLLLLATALAVFGILRARTL